MKSIQDYSFEDGRIKQVTLSVDSIEVLFEQWNNKIIKLQFSNYWKIGDSHSVGEEVSKLTTKSTSKLIDEVIKETIDGNGTKEELDGLKSYAFLSSWGDRVLLEIIAMTINIEEISI